MDFRETGCGYGRWVDFAQDRVQWRAPSVCDEPEPTALSQLDRRFMMGRLELWILYRFLRGIPRYAGDNCPVFITSQHVTVW